MKTKIFSLLLFVIASQTQAVEIPLRIAVIQEFSQFNPITLNLASTEAFMHFVLREVTTRNSSGKLIPDLAEQIPCFENKQAT